jgi:hypothetical protein
MSTNTADRFFSVVIGLAIIGWPSIEGPGDTASGSRGVAGEKPTPGQYSEEMRLPPSPKKKRKVRSHRG